DMQVALLKTYINYINALDNQLLVDICMAANRNLLSSIAKRSHSFDKLIVMNFSLRQSNELDVKGMESGIGSVFAMLPQFVDVLRKELGADKVELDKVTLADMYANLPPGTSFERIEKNVTLHCDAIVDNSKFSHTYGFSHYLAGKYPSAEITFYVYDNLSAVL